MAKTKMTGLLVNGSVRSAGVTFYTRDGQTVVRSSHSNQPMRRSVAQFGVRMRVRHNALLWQALKAADATHFDKGAYSRFRSLSFKLPVVYVVKSESDASFLLPGMPVSEGTLPSVELTLGTVDGVPALLTNLKKGELKKYEYLLLYTVRQDVSTSVPRCRVSVREVSASDMVETDGCLALSGDEYGDDMSGWALVRAERPSEARPVPQCSTQSVVTRCSYYERFTTSEALAAAAESYGGLTGDK